MFKGRGSKQHEDVQISDSVLISKLWKPLRSNFFKVTEHQSYQTDVPEGKCFCGQVIWEMLHPLSLLGNSQLQKVQRNPADSSVSLFKLIYFIMKPLFTRYQEVTSCKTNVPWGTHLEMLIEESAWSVVYSDNFLLIYFWQRLGSSIV